jgi:hypothetical protein
MPGRLARDTRRRPSHSEKLCGEAPRTSHEKTAATTFNSLRVNWYPAFRVVFDRYSSPAALENTRRNAFPDSH